MPDLVDELEDILVRSIGRRMIADVPLGAFLSGGVDLSTVCALIRRKLNRPLMTFSIGFEDAPESEHTVARAFANHLGTIHHDEILSPNASEFLEGIGSVLDEPNADSSCLPTYLLSRFARQHVTVAMSGDGGDEMFAGYGRYLNTMEEYAAQQAGTLPNWKPGLTYFGSRILVAQEPHIQRLFGFVPTLFADHVNLLRLELDQAQGRLLGEMRRTDVDNYLPGAVLPKVDRMSMRHSLEVRTPFLNVELARFAERLPDKILIQGSQGKVLLRELAYRYLPRELINLPKQGFGLPMSDWARSAILDVTGKMVEGDDSRLRAAFGAEGIAQFMEHQRTPGQFSAYQTWAVAMLESWLRHHPAKVPDFAAQNSPRSATATPDREDKVPDKIPDKVEPEAINVFPIDESVYVAARAHGDVLVNPADGPSFNFIPGAVIDRIIELRGTAVEPRASRAEPFTIPGWGQPLDDVPASRSPMQRGAIVFFLDDDAALHFDYFEYQKMMVLGVGHVVLRNPYRNGELIELQLRHFNLFQKIHALIRLFSKRIAMIGNRRLLRILGSKRFAKTEYGYHQSEIIIGIDPIPDEELSSTFMVFEGMRQLPPLQAAHVDIGTKGGGRYSVYNGVLVFSPTESRNLYRKPYWIVRKTDTITPYLPIEPRQNPERLETADPDAELSAIFTEMPDRPFTLNPGDSVVVCTHSLVPGGAERQWVYLAQALADAGYRVTFVTYESLNGEGSHYLSLLDRPNISLLDASQSSVDQIHNFPTTREALAMLNSMRGAEKLRLLNLTSAFCRAAPKVVFAQLDHPNILAGFASHLANVPRVVLSFRNYNPTHFPYLANDWHLPSYRLLSRSVSAGAIIPH